MIIPSYSLEVLAKLSSFKQFLNVCVNTTLFELFWFIMVI